MLRNLRSRRRPRYGSQLCAVIAAVLLLLSVFLLHSRLSSDRQPEPTRPSDELILDSDPLLDDTDTDPEDRNSGSNSDDRIDELDDGVQDDSDSDPSRVSNEDDILRGLDVEEEETDQSKVSKYYFDHVHGAIRRAFDKRSIDQWEDYMSFDANSGLDDSVSGWSKVAFGSDDVALDENVRRKVIEVSGIEDALLLKVGNRVSPLREGWGTWFDAKSDFLRKDRMFKSNLELLNPLNNPFLQDPDGVGVTGLTRGDKVVQKGLLHDIKKKKGTPFLGKKPLGIADVNLNVAIVDDGNNEGKRTEISNLAKDANNGTGDGESNGKRVDSSKNVEANARFQSDLSGQIYADGKRWGYFPGLHPRLSFSNFLDAFFRKGKCDKRFFMVWNSPPWMFSVRHQRGLESLLVHHPDACVVVFSETIELNFFDGFVKDGFKIAVAMPNLDELLKDTPTHVFASVWFEWKKTKFYPTHHSELVRLAALYKYGGVYVDSDVIVLKPLYSLTNTVGLENELHGSQLNGAVMAFKKYSPFIMECLTEFYASYDDNLLRWNGADLLTRVGINFLNKEGLPRNQMELKLQPSFAFFPISRNNITRYFTLPETETERAQHDDLYRRILNESLAFHFWNSITSALIPEPESLVARIINYHCIHCSDVL